MDKIEFKGCRVGDLQVGDVFRQEGPIWQEKETLLRVVTKPHLEGRYGLPHFLMKVAVENPKTKEYNGAQSRAIPDGAVLQCKVQEVPGDKVLAKFLRLGDITNYRCLGGPAKVVALLERPDGLLEVTFEQGTVQIRLTMTKDEAVPVILPKPKKAEESWEKTLAKHIRVGDIIRTGLGEELLVIKRDNKARWLSADDVEFQLMVRNTGDSEVFTRTASAESSYMVLVSNKAKQLIAKL